MLFNSYQFLVFYPVVTLAYFGLPQRLRWAMLLAASCYFYMAFVPVYILILFFTIGVDYVAGLMIEQARGRRRRMYLSLSLAANIGVLAFFKYFNFLNANVAAVAHFLHWNYPISSLQILLPISLSFHTFQSMSYTIEVYRGRHKAERHLGIFALYVMFYPQLVAGPIERPQNLLHQFREVHHFDEDEFLSGFTLMLWGLFKKCVIADRLALYVNQIYDHPFEYRGTPLLISTVFFAVQIYCDFSGYSDVAIGSARTMGFRLMLNFNHPYAADCVPDFWRRWHISLSTFFRDYLYIPMGGSRVSVWRWCYNIMVTFLLSGLWHGASWNFVIWGGLHGLYMIGSRLTAAWREALARASGIAKIPWLRKAFKVLITFSLVNVAWIFFRAPSFPAAVHIVMHLFSARVDSIYFSFSGRDFRLALLCVTIVFLADALRDHPAVRSLAALQGGPRFGLLLLLTLLIFNYGIIDNIPFIYFQF